MDEIIRAWHIGEHGEIFAGRCDAKEMKQFIRELCGEKDGQEQIDSLFEEIPQADLDVEQKWVNEEDEIVMSTWRKLAEECVELPMQISTMYG